MEPYVNLSEKTQLQMASLLTLSVKRAKLIACGFTESEINYPEKILNLKWYLCGDWKILNFLSYFGEEGGIKEFNNFLSVVKNRRVINNDANKYDNYLRWLFSFSKEVEVRGKDFETGVDNLFQLLSSVYIKEDLTFPTILIHKESDYYYQGFWWIPEKAGFANLMNPTSVPNFAKKFFDSMPKRI